VIEIRESPTANTYKQCEEAGTDLGQCVTRDKSIKAMKSLGADLEKELGRIRRGKRGGGTRIRIGYVIIFHLLLLLFKLFSAIILLGTDSVHLRKLKT
ncbi:MAG: hypothetical protein ACKPHQ_14205, partial [Dolichospermum sp.]